MAAYNKIWGEHCCQSDFLLNQVLRKEWEYDGVVISDWGGVHNSEKAANSQLDIEMSVTSDFDDYFMAEPLKKMVQEGKVKESVIDEKVVHILMLMKRLHMLDGSRKKGAYNTPEHRQAALDVARESVVLLKNASGRLPLSPENTKKLLVIGENADLKHAPGGGSAEIKALYEITPLMGIKMLLGGNAEVTYVKGYCKDPKKDTSDTNWQETSLENGGGKTAQAEKEDKNLLLYRKKLLMRLLQLQKFDNIIFIGGLDHEFDCEGNDRKDMKLPYGQDELIEKLLNVNPDIVVVMTGGSPVEMNKWSDRTDSIVWNWYSGMEGGRALAEVLFGQTNPSGKLPESFYKTHMDCSAHSLGEFGKVGSVDYTEGIFVGYRYLDAYNIEPEFCFGHGLSYTTFSYKSAKLVYENKNAYVDCEICNTGTVEGKEVVQVYLAKKNRRQDEPIQQLKGFKKVSLSPGESKTVRIEIEDYSEDMYIRIGSSLKDIRIKL